jgi:hypothetical protein
MLNRLEEYDITASVMHYPQLARSDAVRAGMDTNQILHLICTASADPVYFKIHILSRKQHIHVTRTIHQKNQSKATQKCSMPTLRKSIQL